MFMFSGQHHFQANTVFMSSELQLISPSNRQDLQQLTGRDSSLALPVTSRAISPLSSINLTVDIASINLAPSRLTLADLIQTAVHSLLQTPWALPLRNGKWRRRWGGRWVWEASCLSGECILEAWEEVTSGDMGMSTASSLHILGCFVSNSHTNCYGLNSCCHCFCRTRKKVIHVISALNC